MYHTGPMIDPENPAAATGWGVNLLTRWVLSLGQGRTVSVSGFKDIASPKKH